MFRLYFRSAFRNLLRYKSFSVINLIGLTLGLSSVMVLCTLLYQYITANGQFAHKERMYYVKTREASGEDGMQTPFPLLDELVKRSPQIEAATHIQSWYWPWMKANGKEFQENSMYVDKGFFNVFSYPLEAGNPAVAFNDKYSVVLSHDMARKMFGDGTAVGHTVQLDDTMSVTVTGVLAPIPSNTVFRPEVLLTTDLLKDNKGFASGADWYNTFADNYLLLKPGADTARVNAALADVVHTMYHKENRNAVLYLSPYTNYVRQESGNLVNVMIKGMIGMIVFILLVVVANLVNLNAATLYSRNREVAVRKMVGGSKLHIMMQFCVENFLLVGASIVLAFLLLQALLMPAINGLIGDRFGDIAVNMRRDYPLAIVFVLGGLLMVIFLGSYPAMHLNSIKVTDAIKGKLGTSNNKQYTRNVFITLQFVLAITFIGVTIILNSQIRHMKTASLGFDKDNVLLVNMGLSFKSPKAASARFDALLNDLRNNPYVHGVSTSEDYPTAYSDNYDTYKDPVGGREIHFRHAYVDAGLLSTYKVPIIEGRDFVNSEEPARMREVVINRKAMQMLGWAPGTAVGRSLREGGEAQPFVVVGVMEDFHYQDLTRNIEPLLHHYGGKQQLGWSMLSVRTDPNHQKEVLAQISAAFKEMPSRRNFKATALTDRIDHQYSLLEGILKAVNYAAAMTIFIAAMGLFGLIALFTRQRVKEIGIRKVLGASAGGIVVMLSRNFVAMVGIAMLIAGPICYLIMHRWLRDFAYRVNIEWWMLAGAGLIACVIAVLTVGYHSVRAAAANPVDALRSE